MEVDLLQGLPVDGLKTPDICTNIGKQGTLSQDDRWFRHLELSSGRWEREPKNLEE